MLAPNGASPPSPPMPCAMKLGRGTTAQQSPGIRSGSWRYFSMVEDSYPVGRHPAAPAGRSRQCAPATSGCSPCRSQSASLAGRCHSVKSRWPAPGDTGVGLAHPKKCRNRWCPATAHQSRCQSLQLPSEERSQGTRHTRATHHRHLVLRQADPGIFRGFRRRLQNFRSRHCCRAVQPARLAWPH